MTQDQDDRGRVLDATDIVDLVGDHVALKPKGREFVCLCPFHDDSNPSMYVVPHKRIFHCFVCGAGGNAIDFVMKFHGLDFVGALRFLADRAGIELTPRRVQARATAERADGVGRDDLARANAFAQDFFRSILRHPEHGRAARAVAERRGLTGEVAESFGIGAAPDRWDGLLRTVEAKGQDPRAFLEAGLLKRRTDGSGYYDTFRDRLMFPILDQGGRPIAFGGRVVGESGEGNPKYLNSPETALFNKSATLYGIRQAVRPIQERRRAVVTEGYTDVIACHRAGVGNVVATLGTALTERHASMLRRLCDEVVVLFDGDEAGRRAADRAYEVFFNEPIDVRVAALPPGEDPDDLLASEGGVERFTRLLDDAEDADAYRFARLREGLDAAGRVAGSAGRARAVEDYLARLVELGLRDLSHIRRRLILKKLSGIAGVDEATIHAALDSVRAPRRAASASAPSDDADAPVEGARSAEPRTAAESALACLLAEPGLAGRFPDEASDILDPGAYSSPSLRTLAERLSTLPEGGAAARPADPARDLDDAESRRIAVGLARHAASITEDDQERLTETFLKCVARHRLERARSGVSRDGGDEPETPPHGPDQGARLEAVIARKRRFGPDPTAVPRPAV